LSSQRAQIPHSSFESTGPPGQVAAVAGKKEGMKQGELGGILEKLGYTEDQVRLMVVHDTAVLTLATGV
jgi:hypothetical protein